MTTNQSDNTGTLKEQYALRKKNRKQKTFYEAKELFESHLLILEKLDTASIERIINAMNSIEQGVAPFAKQVPAFKQALDAAEADLTNLVSGKAGNDPKKINAILGKALGLYQGLSEFFREDLPRLLKLSLFKPAQDPAQVTKPMTSVPGMKADVLQQAFEQALAIRKSGGFLKRLFTSSNIPYIDNKALAQQLMQLSFENLTSLSGLSQMPALADQETVNKVAAQAAGQQPSQTASGTAPTSAPKTPVDLAQAIEKLGGVDALAKLITTKQVTDARTLATVLQQALTK